MNLTAEQTAKVAQWVKDGATLALVQAKIAEDFGIKMTYMDVRFLVDDLDLTLATPAAEKSVPAPEPVAEPEPVPAAGMVTVTVDPVQRAGVLVGGAVTFSDGKSGQWMIDGQGRLGLDGLDEGYRPSAEDLQQFQILLKQELAKLGYQ
ncbi:MAG: hypothetical protein K6B46_04415 [Opitutales bacterium]|nr:hypothetical protein [Opitutales bacterium]